MKLEWAAVIGLVLLADAAAAGEDPVLATEQQKASYGMGVAMARSLGRQRAALDADLVARGLRDGLSGRKLLLSDDELRQAMRAYQAELKQRQGPPAKTAAEAKAQGEAFLAENAKKDGVVTLPSGLQYKVLKEGQGGKPTDADTVRCHYRGTFVDGTEFDSSYQKGRPETFKVARVIPGWREALKLMPVGSKWQLFLPSKLAYGERGMRGSRRKRSRSVIGPNQALVFEVELLAIQAPSGPASASGPTTAAGKAPVTPEK